MTYPFLDPDRVTGLYATTGRLARRSTALLAAKIAGSNPNDVLVEAAARHAPVNPRILEVGCGRGSTLARLASALDPAEVVALDTSPAMLAAAANRVERPTPVTTIVGDFHHLPFGRRRFDVVVAAFCLYHSKDPQNVCQELARCLVPGGIALLATKSDDSYRELDELVRESGLDADAMRARSLYATFHSGNIERVAGVAVAVVEANHDDNRFHFATPEHAAAYVATSPKYAGCGEPPTVAAALRRVWPDGGLIATSTVSIVMGRKR